MTNNYNRPQGAIGFYKFFELVQQSHKEPIIFYVGYGKNAFIMDYTMNHAEIYTEKDQNSLFVKFNNVRGFEEHRSLDDMNIIPNDYNENYVFTNREDAERYMNKDKQFNVHKWGQELLADNTPTLGSILRDALSVDKNSYEPKKDRYIPEVGDIVEAIDPIFKDYTHYDMCVGKYYTVAEVNPVALRLEDRSEFWSHKRFELVSRPDKTKVVSTGYVDIPVAEMKPEDMKGLPTMSKKMFEIQYGDGAWIKVESLDNYFAEMNGAVTIRIREAQVQSVEDKLNELGRKGENLLAGIKALKKDAKMIYAIKLLRDNIDCGLKEAKDYVESL